MPWERQIRNEQITCKRSAWGEYNIKMYPKEKGAGDWLHSSIPGYGPVMGPREQDTQLFIYMIYRLTTGWTVRDRIPMGTRFSARPDRPWGPPSLLYNGYQVFPGGKERPGRVADHSPPSSAAVMEE